MDIIHAGITEMKKSSIDPQKNLRVDIKVKRLEL